MGVITCTDEYTSPISPARLFKALVLDAHNLVPNLMPQAVKSIDTLQGDGRAGSIKQINFAEGSQLKSVTNRVDQVDEENFVYGYTLIEGDALVMEKLEYVSYEVKFEAAEDGGSKNKMVSKYHTKGDFVLQEEDIKAGREKALGMYKVVEAYLLLNPDAYA
ncbi:PREDICTED: major allergen Pru ar 1-like [Prunus mume]|uniref:Major allergen Pru ar 1-like n=1 Tax=Prunus mume TaxID=102107 RepID=A0ABM0NDV6_PRUMU|nr:PREDICTED: major allergen Pru ar 1-like [Prunus mume]